MLGSFQTPYASQRPPYEYRGTIGDILRLRSEAAADATRRSGDIRGQLWGRLGDIAGATIGNYVQQKQDAPRRELEAMQIDEARGAINRERSIRDVGRLTQGNPEAYAREVGTIDPERGRKLQADARQQQQEELTQLYQRLNQHKTAFGKAAQILTEVQAQPALYPQLRPHIVELAGSIDPSLAEHIPETFHPERVTGMLQFAMGGAEERAKQVRGLELFGEAGKEVEGLAHWYATAKSPEDWAAITQEARRFGVSDQAIGRFGEWSPEAPARAERMTMTPAQRAAADRAANGGTDDRGSDYSRFLQRWADAHGLKVDGLTAEQELQARGEFFEAGRAPNADASGRGRSGRGRQPGAENPSFPPGVQDYLVSMRSRGYTRDQAESEVFRRDVWAKLREAHPRLNLSDVQRAVAQLFADDAGGGEGGSIFGAQAGRGVPVPSAPAAPAGGGDGDGEDPKGRRVASRSDVARVAHKLKISEADARKRLEAAGVMVQ